MQTITPEDSVLIDRHAKVTLFCYIDGDRLSEGLGRFEYTSSCGSAEEFSFGNACAAGISLVLGSSRPDLKGHRINVTWSVSVTEYPLFSGRIENAVVSASCTTVEAWDDMYYGGSAGFVPPDDAQGDIDASVLFLYVADSMGVAADPVSLEALSGIVIEGSLDSLPDESSNSAVAGYIAGLLGGNALMTRSGELAIRIFAQSGWTTEPYAGGANAHNTDFAITGITLQRDVVITVVNPDGTTSEEEQLQEFCAGDGTLMINNPFADQAAADRAFIGLENITVRPGTYSFPGGILLDPGDIIQVESMDGTYRVAAVMINMSFDGGVKTTISCGGALDAGGATGAINQALTSLAADFARLRSLVAENATIVSAKITNLRAEDIVAGRIRSTDFSAITLPEIYPTADLFPSDVTYPNNGEEIIRGFEIDFASGVIRGVFYNVATDALAHRVEALEQRMENLEALLT